MSPSQFLFSLKGISFLDPVEIGTMDVLLDHMSVTYENVSTLTF